MPKCIHPDCNVKYANFNLPGVKPGIYCAKHKLDGMINVKSKTCQKEGCLKQPSYNTSGEKQGIYCTEHKLDGMVDVVNKTCQKEGCETRAGYGKLFKPKIHCAKHRLPNEYKDNNPKCTKCDKPPWYLEPDYLEKTDDKNYPLLCEDHASKDAILLKEFNCKNCNLPNIINEKTKLCNDCNDFIIKGHNKAKENRIRDILTANGYVFEQADRIVEGGCSKYRPDFIIDYKLFKVVLEVDENQHKSYACECEQGRMIQIHQDFGGTPVLFIRYNPDSYIDHGKKRRPANKSRESVLISLLNGLKNRTEWEGKLSVYYLFYDGFNGIPEIQEINYM